MYKIVLIIAMKSILFSQDKMILKGGEEIILLDRTNFIDYDDSYSFIEYKSKYYAKNKIALLIINNGEMSRDFTYIDDIVEAVIKCAFKVATPNFPSKDQINNLVI